MAYDALQMSATEVWNDFNIDECVVIPDFKGEVTDKMMYIKPDYTFEQQVCTVTINHTDGCGMMLPEVSTNNFMVRGPYCKGLLVSFPWLQFCKEHNVDPVVTDVWGKEHDLEKEGIKIIFFDSMMKMWPYYDSWDAYKAIYKKCGAHFGRTNYEEDDIESTTICYQMLQSLQDFSDDEVRQFTYNEHERIQNITKDKFAMLRTLKANKQSDIPYKAALAWYPELLWEAYTRNQLKDIRKRMLLDAKSGKIKMMNKRLFAIPDLYAACEYIFCHIEHPTGLLPKGTVACKVFRNYNKADVLRSPHLYMEHSVQNISHDDEVYRWFYTNAIATSTHDLITRILQLDVDGDQLNVVVDKLLVEIAERNIQKYDVIPLFYDANKAPKEKLSKESLYNALKRAHDYSSGGITSIGEISNMLTRLWNKDNPDRIAAAWLTMFNNLVDSNESLPLNVVMRY